MSIFRWPTLESGLESDVKIERCVQDWKPGSRKSKIRVENQHEAKQVEEENNFDEIPNDGMMEDNYYSYMRNAGWYYCRVLRVEMM